MAGQFLIMALLIYFISIFDFVIKLLKNIEVIFINFLNPTTIYFIWGKVVLAIEIYNFLKQFPAIVKKCIIY